MRKKIVIAVLISAMLIVSLVTAIAPTFAERNEDSNIFKNQGTGSMVYLNSPDSSRPSIQLRAYDFNRHSIFGKADGMLVYVFSPTSKVYVLAGYLTDNPEPEYLNILWAKTNIWNPDAGITNLIKLEPEELEVYTESSATQGNWFNNKGSNDDTLIVSLTKAVTIKISSITFEIPPMTLKFIPIGESYYSEGANSVLPSGYMRQPIATMRTPAWVEQAIPSWFGPVAPQEVCGHIDYKYIEAITPPA